MSDRADKLRQAAEIIRTAKVSDPLLFDLRDAVMKMADWVDSYESEAESQAKRIAEQDTLLKAYAADVDGWKRAHQNIQDCINREREHHALALCNLREAQSKLFNAGKRIAELEAERDALKVDAAKLNEYWCDEQEPYPDVGNFLDCGNYGIGDTFELTKCYAEKKPTKFRVVSRGLDICGEPILDVEAIDAAKKQQ